jgi:hypothetical protein
MGDIWVLVTPFKNWVYVNDPDALMDIFRRGSAFPRPTFINGILNHKPLARALTKNSGCRSTGRFRTKHIIG